MVQITTKGYHPNSTGEARAEAAERLLNGQLKNPDYQSAALAFGHGGRLKTFHQLGYCNLPAS